jgi:hypothetical protein
VKSVLEELMKVNYTASDGVYKDLIDIAMKWHTYKKEEKNKNYSKNHCHELNIFIFFKDRPYFDEIVRPYLSHKMEKTFIDYYLLGRYE